MGNLSLIISIIFSFVPHPKQEAPGKSFYWRGYKWEVFSLYDKGSGNFFDDSLVIVSYCPQVPPNGEDLPYKGPIPMDTVIIVKANRFIVDYGDIECPYKTKNGCSVGKLYAGAFHLSGYLGPVGTYKFEFTIPELAYDEEYLIQGDIGGVVYTFYSGAPWYEYDIPEIYGTLRDTLAHFNFYQWWPRELARRNKAKKIAFNLPEFSPFTIVAYLSVFGDPNATRGRVDSIISCVKYQGSYYTSMYCYTLSKKNPVDTPFLVPYNKPLTPEFYVWWPFNKNCPGSDIGVCRPNYWEGPNSIVAIVKDFKYSPVPIDPRPSYENEQGNMIVYNYNSFNTTEILHPQYSYRSRLQHTSIKVFDALGRLKISTTCSVSSDACIKQLFSRSSLPKGMYFITVSQPDGRTRRLPYIKLK